MKFSDLFGEYKAPAWMSKLGKKIGRGFGFVLSKLKDVFGKIKAHKKGFVLGMSVSVIALAAAFTTVKVIGFIKANKPVEILLNASVYSSPNLYEEEDFMSPLVVKFNADILKSLHSEEEEENLLGEKISITPNVKGKWIWTEEENHSKTYQKISFVPEEKWKLNTKYKITFADEIASKNQILKTPCVEFSTPIFTAGVSESYFDVDDLFPDNKYAVCTFFFNFPLSSDNVDDFIEIRNSKAFTEKLDKKLSVDDVYPKYKFVSEISEDRKKLLIRTESIPVPDESFRITVKLHEGLECKYDAKLENGCEPAVRIPGLNDYVGIEDAQVMRIDVDDERNLPVLEFTTSNYVSVGDFAKFLEVYQLPADRPEEPGVKKDKNHEWNSLKEISEKVISMSQKISFTAIAQEEEMQKSCGFELDLLNENPLFVRVKSGMEFHGGYKSKRESVFLLNIPKLEKRLRISCEGNIVNLRGSHKIEISSVDIEKIKVTLYRMKPGEVNHIASMSNGSMTNFYFDSYDFDENNVSEKYTEVINVKNHVPGKLEKTVFDFSKYLARDAKRELKNGLFIIQVNEKYNGEDSSDDDDYYWDYYDDRRFIMVTDLGLIAKTGNEGERDVFVQSIRTGNSVSGATVEVIAKNGDVIKRGYADVNGRVSLGKIKNESGALSPVAYTVSYGDDFCFMPFESNDRYLGFSNFQVSGSYEFENKDDVKSYIFCDRGIYRPGESVRLAAITKTLSLGKETVGLPCVLEIYSGDDFSSNYYDRKKVFSQDFKIAENGLNEFEVPSEKWNSQTYSAVIRVKKTEEKIGSCSFKVKNYVPDNLKINVRLGDEADAKKGWVKPEDINAHIHLENLYGKAAVGNRISGELLLLPGFPSIMLEEKFQDYSFGYLSSIDSMQKEKIPDSTTDENGNVDLKINLKKYASSSFAVSLSATGFGKGTNDSVSGDEISGGDEILVSPLDYMIGWKTDSYLGYIKKDARTKINLIAVDNNFNEIDLDNVDCSVCEYKYVSVLTKRNGVFKYQSEKKELPVENQKLKISRNGSDIILPTGNGGEYCLIVEKDGNVFAKVYYSVESVENTSRSLTKTNELSLKLDKQRVRAGENVKVFIKSPYSGSGYIFVERGKLYSCKHFRMSGLTSEQAINIPKELDGKEGNVYISVFIAKDTYSDEIFMNPLCYGALPLSLSLDKVDDKIKLEVPDEIKPNEKLTVSYSSDKKTKIILMAVDEGILSVAKHQSPNPFDFFFEKRALTTDTYTTLNLVMPEYDVAKSAGAFGGGAGLAEKFLFNPFRKMGNKSVAFWSGILDCAQKKQNYTFDIPSDFNGSLRVMAVSCGEISLGCKEKSVRAASDIVITPTILESVNTSDEFDVPVTVANISKTNKSVEIKIDGGNMFSVLPGQNSYRKTVNSNGEVTVGFTVKSNGKNGSGKVRISVTSDGEEFVSERVVTVHPETPFNTWNSSGVIYGGSGKAENDVNVARELYANFAERKITLTYHPSGMMGMMKDCLQTETFGQTGRVISKAFAALTDRDCDENRKIVDDAIQCVNLRCTANGHVKNYAGVDSAWSELLDTYATFFITEAKERGYSIPDGLGERLVRILKDNISSKVWCGKCFAIYVLTRNEVVTTNYIENLLRSKKINELTSDEKGYIFASRKILGFEKEPDAEMLRLIKSMKDSVSPVLAYLCVKNFSGTVSADPKWFEIALSRYCSRREMVMAMLGLSEYSKNVEENEDAKFYVTQHFPKYCGVDSINVVLEKQKDSWGNTVFTGTFDPRAESIKIKNSETNPLYFNVSVSGFEKASRSENPAVEIKREFMKDGKPVQTLEIGDIVEVKITVHSLLNGNYGNFILSDIFPACLKANEDSFSSYSYDWNTLNLEGDRAVLLLEDCSGVKYFTYKARVVSSGEFTIPPIVLESVDDDAPLRVMSYEEKKLRVKP